MNRFKPSREVFIRKIRRLIGISPIREGPPKRFTKDELKEISIFIENCRNAIINLNTEIIESDYGVKEACKTRTNKEEKSSPEKNNAEETRTTETG